MTELMDKITDPYQGRVEPQYVVPSFKRKLLSILYSPLADCFKTPSEPYGHFLDSIRIFLVPILRGVNGHRVCSMVVEEVFRNASILPIDST